MIYPSEAQKPVEESKTPQFNSQNPKKNLVHSPALDPLVIAVDTIHIARPAGNVV